MKIIYGPGHRAKLKNSNTKNNELSSEKGSQAPY